MSDHIISLCALLVAHQIKGEATIPQISTIKPAHGDSSIKIAHGLLRIFKLDHRRAQRRLDHRITRGQRFSPRKKAQRSARIP